MQTKLVDRKIYIEKDDAWVEIPTWELVYDETETVLHISQVVVENDEILNRQTIASQPYKTNPDGTTQQWTGAEDAFEWFENRKDSL